MQAPLRRLVPEPSETTVADEIAALDFISGAHDDRPFTVTNFALTVDGRATISGRSGPIGTDTDTAMLVGLRTKVDAVMIGAGTMRAERYGPIPGERLMVLISKRLDLPWDAELFTSGRGSVLVFTCAEEDPPETATPVDVIRHEGHRRPRRSDAPPTRRARRSRPAQRGWSPPARPADRGGPGRRAVHHGRGEARGWSGARARGGAARNPSASSSSPGWPRTTRAQSFSTATASASPLLDHLGRDLPAAGLAGERAAAPSPRVAAPAGRGRDRALLHGPLFTAAKHPQAEDRGAEERRRRRG